jgi:hypothetical protein
VSQGRRRRETSEQANQARDGRDLLVHPLAIVHRCSSPSAFPALPGPLSVSIFWPGSGSSGSAAKMTSRNRVAEVGNGVMRWLVVGLATVVLIVHLLAGLPVGRGRLSVAGVHVVRVVVRHGRLHARRRRRGIGSGLVSDGGELNRRSRAWSIRAVRAVLRCHRCCRRSLPLLVGLALGLLLLLAGLPLLADFLKLCDRLPC